MNKINRMRIVAFTATLYILLAFAWWTVLLIRKNEETREAYIEKLRSDLKFQNLYTTENQMVSTSPYQQINSKYNRQMWMIWSEGGALFLGLLLGMFYIHRGFNKEIALGMQQRNFLLSITHELKSPIASIQLVLDTFKKRTLDDKQKEALTTSAQKEVERLNELVNNLLMSAKLETAYEIVLEEININTLIDEIISKLKMKFPKVSFHFDKKEVPILRGDKQCMVSIFNNLLENSVKYTQNQPYIHLKSSYMDDKFTFDIADNGIGIPAIEREKVFEKFYRIGNEDTRRTKGTGLGLYIVSQGLKAHNGNIQIFENQPKGTIFRVTIPSL